MRSFLSFFVFACVVVPWAPSHASLMIEPYLGYERGQVYAVSGSTGDVSMKTSGAIVGGRLGYALPILFWTALDYSLLSGGTGKFDIASGEATLNRSDLYLTVGVDLPILLRAWAGYGLSNELKFSKSGVDTTVKGGTNLKAGVGLTMLPFVSLNLELYNHKGGSVDVAGTNTSFNTYEDAGAVISVSLPLNL